MNVGDDRSKNTENLTCAVQDTSEKTGGLQREDVVCTPKSGIKRAASVLSPPDEAKKVKIVTNDSDTSEIECIVIEDDGHTENKTELSAPTTPKTPKTPKMTKEEREQLRLKKLEEKERQKAEREEKRLEKEKEKEEKRLEKERKEKEKLEKKCEEERRKEEKKKEAEDKRKKEEEEKLKRKKEEEEKKEAKRKEEEAVEEKKKRESARFLNFFNKVEKKKASVIAEPDNWYRPFELKPGMTLAPILHRESVPIDKNILDQDEEVTNTTYLTSEEVKKRKIIGCRKIKGNLKAKLYQFHLNYRPPYYGTWRTRPKVLNGRTPFGQEPGLDYEVESDDEWEEEPSDGEECRSDEEDDGEEVQDEEDEDGFFVPPCYLSDGEGEESDNEEEKPIKLMPEDTDEKAEEAEKLVDGAARTGRVEGEEERRARMAARASEWTRRVSRAAQLVTRCYGPFFDGPITVDKPQRENVHVPDDLKIYMKAVRLN